MLWIGKCLLTFTIAYMYNMKIVVCTGGFDPIHSGHVNYLKEAKSLGDKLIVGLNSDAWLVRKKGKTFMTYQHRKEILTAIRYVDDVVAFDDADNSACNLLESLKHSYPYAEIIFANGGDRTAANIPELAVKDIIFKFSVGGDNKTISSSELLQKWKQDK